MSQVDSRLPGDAGEREAETRWHGPVPGPGRRHISCHIFTSQGASDVIKWSLWVIFHVLIKKMLVDETWYNAKITWYVRRKKFYTVHSSYHNTRNKIWNPPFLIKCLSFYFEALKCRCTEYQVQVAQSITGSLHQLHRDWSERARRLMEMSWCLQSPVRITHWSTICFILINCWLTQTNNHFPSGAGAVRGLIISDIIITLIITDIILTLIFRAPDRYISPGVRG